jgi:hypothetical protein
MKTKHYESIKSGPHGSGYGVYERGNDKPIEWGIRCHAASRMVKELQKRRDAKDEQNRKHPAKG